MMHTILSDGHQGRMVGSWHKKHCMQVPEPFQLPGDALHQHAEAAKQQYLEEEEQKRKAQAAFKVWLPACVDIFAYHAKLNRPALTCTLSMYYQNQSKCCMHVMPIAEYTQLTMMQSCQPLYLACTCLQTIMGCHFLTAVAKHDILCTTSVIWALLQAQLVKVGHAVAIQPSNAALTVPDAPRLTLNDRSASRQAFDAALAQKQKQAEVSLHAWVLRCCAV